LNSVVPDFPQIKTPIAIPILVRLQKYRTEMRARRCGVRINNLAKKYLKVAVATMAEEWTLFA
jgi:hypothetical protein